jgi:hypothetical protein
LEEFLLKVPNIGKSQKLDVFIKKQAKNSCFYPKIICFEPDINLEAITL